MIPAIFGLLFLPVILLNIFGGIVGGIWLATLGQWGLIGVGIFSIFISSLGLNLILAVGLIFSVPGALAFERHRYLLGIILASIGNLWTCIIMTVWSVSIFYIALSYFENGPIWPYLVWAYSMATGPWTHMAVREGQNAVASNLSAFAACVGAIAIIGIVLLKSDPTITDAVIAFCIPICIALVIQVWLAFVVIKYEQRGAHPAA